MRTTAVVVFVLLAAAAMLRPAPRHAVAEAPRNAPAPIAVSTAPGEGAPPEPESALPAVPTAVPVDVEIEAALACTSSAELAARLTLDPPDAVAIAIVIALGRTGDPAALPALRAEVEPSRPFLAAHALQAIHEIERADLAGRLAGDLLRSPELADPDPVYHAAAVVTGVRIDDIVSELAEAAEDETVRARASDWLESRRAHAGHPPCGKEHP